MTADNPRIEELRRRVQMDPASIAFAALAEEYRRAGRFEEAIAICATGLKRHPAYLSAHVTLGRALLEIGRYDEAREELELVLRTAPENLAAIRGLAEIHERRGDAGYPSGADDPGPGTHAGGAWAPEPVPAAAGASERPAPATGPIPWPPTDPEAASPTRWTPRPPDEAAWAPEPAARADSADEVVAASGQPPHDDPIADPAPDPAADAQVRALQDFLDAVTRARGSATGR